MPSPSALLLATLMRASGPPDSGPGGPQGEPLPLRVGWTAGPSCPDAEALRLELVRLLHRELRFDPDADARVEGVIVPRAGGFELALSVWAGELHERRTLRAERCEDLRTAAALVVAVALEPWAAGEAPPVVPEPEDEPAAPPAQGAPAATPTVIDPRGEPAPPTTRDRDDASLHPASPGPPPSPPARRRGRVALLVHGGLGIAQHAMLAGGLGGALAYLGRGWRVELTGLHWWPTPIDVAGGVSVRPRATVGGLRGCWVPRRGRWELPICGGLEAGGVRASATGPGVTTTTSTGPWLGVLAGAGAAWRATGWLSVRAGADLTVSAWRSAFHLQQGATAVPVLTQPPVGLRVLAGVELRLPPSDE